MEEINCTPGQEYLVQGLQEPLLYAGQLLVGDIDHDLIKSQQIEETIRQLPEKALRFQDLGSIKVLSLFFIDRVSNYRIYPEEGPYQNAQALMFEEKFKMLASRPRYASLFFGEDFNRWQRLCMVAISPRTKGLQGYKRQYRGDEDAYALIMRDKEELLSFNKKLSFIFSHSALREGWDNPNVFQICTLMKQPVK